ncbi:MAG: hypothetical protein IPO87_10860 [Flavobacteriales bacterium]|nr:hypothetical protein [Flavobacteriales bacterium]
MIIYLTYNDQPSGVYWSQVTDVVDHLNTLGGPPVKLFALVSARGFSRTRRAIKQRSPKALVLPMVPQMARWKKNTWILSMVCRFVRPTGIIARGVFATWMAQRMRDRGSVKKVCFDGRGAYAAEWEEYRLIDDDALIAQFRPLEMEAVNGSDFRISVTHALVDHWRERYDYRGKEHIVVPCTLGADHGSVGGELGRTKRNGSPFSETDVVLVYSGSTAGWQSFGLLEELLSGVLDEQPNVKVLFLSKSDENNAKLVERYPGRVSVQWLDPDQVAATLGNCDLGIMVRENTVTNNVASPTKFGEYLAAGLPVVISEHLGDFSALVMQDSLGLVHREGTHMATLQRTTNEERTRLQHYAEAHFTKKAFNSSYLQLLSALR